MTKIKIELDYDQTDEIVRQSLIETIRDVIDNDWVMYHSYEQTWKTLCGVLHALEYYSTEKQLKEVYTEEFKNSISELMSKVENEILGR